MQFLCKDIIPIHWSLISNMNKIPDRKRLRDARGSYSANWGGGGGLIVCWSLGQQFLFFRENRFLLTSMIKIRTI